MGKNKFIIVAFIFVSGLFVFSLFVFNRVAMAAINFGSSATANNTASGANTIVINKPAFTSSGDVLIAAIVVNGGNETTLTSPAGWTLIRRTDNFNNVGMATYYHVAGSSEGVSYTWNIIASQVPRAVGGIIRYTGVNTINPIDVSSGNSGDNNSVQANSVTTTAANDRVIAFLGMDNDPEFGQPNGTFERYDLAGPSGNGPAGAAADFTQVNAGATGNKISIATLSDKWVAQQVALKAVPLTGIVTGMKFEDLNGNGVKDQGEPGLGGWTIKLKQNNQITTTTQTNQDGVYSFFNVFSGVYSVEEDEQDGWTQTTADFEQITINPGDVISNIDFGNFHEAIITGLKWDDKNGNGQRDQDEPGQQGVEVQLRRVLPGHYPVQDIQIDTEIIQLSLTSANGGFELRAPAPGNFVVTESPANGYQETYPVDSFFDVFVEVSSQDIRTGHVHVCQPTPVTICEQVPLEFGNFKLITVTVEKDVVAPDGQTNVSDSHPFSVMLDGSNQKSVSENNPATYTNVGPGTHTLTEIGDPDFDLLHISNGTFQAISGQDVTIVVTNSQKKGHLTVIKHVTNHGIGEAIASDFTINVNRGDVAFVSFLGSEEGASVEFDPGNYSVSELWPDGYAMSLSDDCSGEIASNAEATCIITNSDIPIGQGAITVIKEIINDNGGTLSRSNFPLEIMSFDSESMTVQSGQANFLEIGEYVVGESSLVDGYTQTGISCTNGVITLQNGNITLNEQEAWTCTITNDDNPTSLTLNKVVINNNGGTSSASDWTLSAANGNTILEGNGPFVENTNFQAGTFTLFETGPSGYSASDWVCEGGTQIDANHITLALGQSATCTITNTYHGSPPKLTVNKIVVNDNGGTKQISDFPLFVGEQTVIPGVQNNFDPGVYIISETADSNYTATFSGDCNATSTITLQPDDIKTCMITNDDILAPIIPPEQTGSPNTTVTEETTSVALGNSSGGGGGSGQKVFPWPIETESPQAATTLTGQVLGAATFKFTFNLKLKMSDEAISELQKRLLSEGVYSGSVTGYFGKLTFAGVKTYQKKYGISQTGFVGPLTRAQLNGQIAGASSVIDFDATQAQIAVLQAKIDDLFRQVKELQSPGN